MYYLLDLDNFKLLKVTKDLDACFYWADILLPGRSYYVDDFNLKALMKWQDFELHKLYHGTTGDKITSRVEKSTIAGLLLNIESLLDTTPVPELHGRLGRLPSEPSCGELATHSQGPASRPAGQPSAPRMGNVAQVIYEAADTAWERAGRPLDLKIILKLRKEIMDELEKLGVKRTTASSTLGAWQKERISDNSVI